MSEPDYIKSMREYSEELCKDPVRLKAFLRSVMGPPKRTLEGEEKESVWLMIRLSDNLISTSNNQHTITEVYHVNQKEYHVTYFDGSIEIEEMLPDD